MATKPKKRKRKIRVRTGAKVVRKDSVQRDSVMNDTLPRMQEQLPRSNGAVLKVKMRKR